jgi:hypothetical protein
MTRLVERLDHQFKDAKPIYTSFSKMIGQTFNIDTNMPPSSGEISRLRESLERAYGSYRMHIAKGAMLWVAIGVFLWSLTQQDSVGTLARALFVATGIVALLHQHIVCVREIYVQQHLLEYIPQGEMSFEERLWLRTARQDCEEVETYCRAVASQPRHLCRLELERIRSIAMTRVCASKNTGVHGD